MNTRGFNRTLSFTAGLGSQVMVGADESHTDLQGGHSGPVRTNFCLGSSPAITHKGLSVVALLFFLLPHSLLGTGSKPPYPTPASPLSLRAPRAPVWGLWGGSRCLVSIHVHSSFPPLIPPPLPLQKSQEQSSPSLRYTEISLKTA